MNKYDKKIKLDIICHYIVKVKNVKLIIATTKNNNFYLTYLKCCMQDFQFIVNNV